MPTFRVTTTPYHVSYSFESSEPVRGKAKQTMLNNIARISASLFSGGLSAANGLCAMWPFTAMTFEANLEDPKVVMEIRRKVQGQPLAQVLSDYDWETIFRYELVSPEKFTELYRSHVESLPFCELLECFHQASEALKMAKGSWLIPSPSEWKAKFEAETEKLSCKEIAEKYPLEDLRAFVSQSQMEMLEKSRNATDEFLYKKGELEQEFRDKTVGFHTDFVKAEEDANKAYNHAHLDVFENVEELINLKTDLLGSSIEFPFSFGIRTKGKEERLRELEVQRAMAQENLKNAERVRRFAMNRAEEEYQKKMAPIRKEIDARHAENQAEYDAKIQSYEKDFASVKQPVSPIEGLKEVSKQEQIKLTESLPAS